MGLVLACHVAFPTSEGHLLLHFGLQVQGTMWANCSEMILKFGGHRKKSTATSSRKPCQFRARATHPKQAPRSFLRMTASVERRVVDSSEAVYISVYDWVLLVANLVFVPFL